MRQRQNRRWTHLGAAEVPHPCSHRDLSRLTSEVGRDQVRWARYGHRLEELRSWPESHAPLKALRSPPDFTRNYFKMLPDLRWQDAPNGSCFSFQCRLPHKDVKLNHFVLTSPLCRDNGRMQTNMLYQYSKELPHRHLNKPSNQMYYVPNGNDCRPSASPRNA